MTTFLEISIAPYQCCQSYLKSLKTCSKVAIKISSREQELESAFHSGNSTETALIRLADKIFFKVDNDELSGLVFVDFHKAFDILDHNLLLKKLSVYGANPDSVAWFQLYLEG